jgi:hypothetical protein
VSLFLLGVLVAGAAVVLTASDADANNLVQGLVVAEDPVDFTPNILDGHVEAITTVGDRVVVGGTFTQVKQVGDPTTCTRNYLLAFDRNTGALDTSFVPQLDGAVWALEPAPDGSSVIVGGAFATVNGVSNFGVARLNMGDGTMAAGFSASTAGKVRDLAIHGNTVYLGGDIWSVNGVPRTRLAAIDATTGQLDPSLDIGPTAPRVSVDWVSELDVSPDGNALMVIGTSSSSTASPGSRSRCSTSPAPRPRWRTGPPIGLRPPASPRSGPTCATSCSRPTATTSWWRPPAFAT